MFIAFVIWDKLNSTLLDILVESSKYKSVPFINDYNLAKYIVINV